MTEGTLQQIQPSGRMSQPALLALWRQYREHGDLGARDRLVLSLAPVVKSIVYRKAREIPPHRGVEDFISCGLEALIRSLDRYDPDRGTTLEQFVWTRIHGAVLDELRVFDWVPRSLRRVERDINRVRERFAVYHGRPPTQRELSAALAISEAELADRQDDLARSEIGSLNSVVAGEDGDSSEWLDVLASDDPTCDPEASAIREWALVRFREAFDHLASRTSPCCSTCTSLTLKEIGDLLGVSERPRLPDPRKAQARLARRELALDAPLLLSDVA
jgi:RNA polymerase sigma factor for flagellar operon FliA